MPEPSVAMNNPEPEQGEPSPTSVRYLTAEGLLKLPVRLGDVELGRPTDLLIDLERLRVIGLTVRRSDHTERFLPLAAATLRDDEIATDSALALLEESAFYRKRGVSLRSLQGALVEVRGKPAGLLFDLEVSGDGEVRNVVARSDGRKPIRIRAERATVKLRGKAKVTP